MQTRTCILAYITIQAVNRFQTGSQMFAAHFSVRRVGHPPWMLCQKKRCNPPDRTHGVVQHVGFVSGPGDRLSECLGEVFWVSRRSNMYHRVNIRLLQSCSARVVFKGMKHPCFETTMYDPSSQHVSYSQYIPGKLIGTMLNCKGPICPLFKVP